MVLFIFGLIVSVAINGGTPYVCALEEAFSNDFIFRKRGYSAPVLRLYEDFLFPHWVYGWKHKEVKIPEINHSYIYCFVARLNRAPAIQHRASVKKFKSLSFLSACYVYAAEQFSPLSTFPKFF